MANKEMKTLTFGNVTYEIVDEKARQELSAKGKPNGVATLDKTGKVPEEQLPEFSTPPDWNQEVSSAKDYIKNKPPIENGNGKNSVIIGTGNAVSSYSISEGMMTQAGSKAFSIIGYEFSRGGFTGYLLDSAEGLEVGDIYSMHVCYNNLADENTIKSQQYINYGKITGIRGPVTKADYEDGGRYQSDGLCIVNELADTDSGYVVYVDKAFYRDDNNNSLSFPDSFIDDNGIDNEKSTFRILQKPNIGTRLIGEYTHAEGINTIAMSKGGHAEGKYTRAEGSYGHAEGKNTKAWYCAHAEGKNTIASGENSHAEGVNTLASLHASHAEGCNSKAISYCTHAEGRDTTASNDSAHAEGESTTASGNCAHAEGWRTTASGVCSHSEGSETNAINWNAHAEGSGTTASGENSHAEGNNTTAGGKNSHAEGRGTTTSGDGSHAEGVKTSATFGGAHSEGSETNAINWNAHAEGKNTTASGDSAHAEGQNTTASGQSAHAEGENTIASNRGTHAEGVGTQAKQGGAHSEGNNTQALEWNSHSEGKGTIANGYEQHVQGRYNVKDTAKGGGNYAHIVGNGTSDTDRRNIHTVDWEGNGWYQGSVTSNGADYAEYFEWLDGNPDNEDRVGLLVALDGEKIRLANVGDEIIGIISGTAAVLGDNYECSWHGRFLTDDFGRELYEDVEEFIDVEVGEDENGNPITEKQSLGFFKHPKQNPNYDPSKEYIKRSDRPEWDAVGMLGKLYIRDDGTCQVNGYATVGENGIATSSSEKTNMRVLSRVNDNVVRVLLK